MNYHHSYHAGNFADVLKHSILVTILNALQAKQTPYCFLDTHAGIGLYDLQSAATQKSQEYLTGIARLHAMTETPPDIEQYLNIVRYFNTTESVHYYPGSPEIAASLLRSQDRMVLCELHPDDYQTLKKNMPRKQNTSIHLLDAYKGMKAFLPPKENRGIVLIDPPFEKKDEIASIHQALQRALKHWRSGIYLIWYPIKNQTFIPQCDLPFINVQLKLNTIADSTKLNACGLAIINPPWKLATTLETIILPHLEIALDATCRLYSANL